MKHFFTTLLLLFAACYATAQVNLREGYVITLQGDTLKGSVDYRSDYRNSKQCIFIANGSDKYTTFLPGEIHSYRFVDNGRYYISKTVQIGNEGERTVFLEYLVRGEMSLYFLSSTTSADMFFFENKDGEIAQYQEEKIGYNSTSVRRRNLNDALSILIQSPKATSLLWNNDNDQDNATKVVLAYNDEVCPDGACDIFQYKAAKTPKEERGHHYYFKVGLDTRGYNISDEIERMYPERTVKEKMLFTVSPKLSFGQEIYLMRLARGLIMQTQLNYSFTSGKKEFTRQVYSQGQLYEVSQYFKISEHDFELQIGPAYEKELKNNLKLRLRGGANIRVPLGTYSYFREDPSNPDKPIFDNSGDLHTPYVSFGQYIGAGLLIPTSKGALLVDLDITHNKMNHISTNCFGVSVGYQLK